MSLSNPLNLILIPPILYLLYRRLVPSLPSSPSVLPNKYDENVYNWMPARHPDVLCHKSYTPVELAELDGRKNPNGRICLAIMRVGGDGKVSPGLERTVFDVSSGASFYGPGISLVLDIRVAS
jgi:membrane-associated progesterone receptor component